MKKVLTLVFVTGLVATSSLAQTPSATDLFQEALAYEEVKGDLQKAIVTYQTILKSFANDRPASAKAQLALARCLEKLGRPDAVTAYEKVVREYGDHPALAAEARARLAALKPVGNGNGDGLIERQQVWVGDDVNFDGGASSDGRYLAYVVRSTGQVNVAVRDLRTGQSRVLETARGSAKGSPYFPSISPDGQFIAFGWEAHLPEGDRYSINMVRFDGTGARVVAAQASIDGLAWAPDGKRLAAMVFNKDRTKKLVLVSVSNGGMTQLRSFGAGQHTIGGFSPDGRFLTFVAPPEGAAAEGANSDIFAIAVDGSSVNPLASGSARESQPQWTPDGGAIVFVSDRSGPNSLWTVRVQNGSPVGSPAEIRPNIGTIDSKGFSRNGTFLYGVSNASRDVYIASVDPETLRVTSVARKLSDQGTGTNSTPEWSPDGRFIAFLRGPDRRNQTIVIRSVANGIERTLPTKIVDAVFLTAHGLSWTPDGRSLVVRDTHPSQERRVVVRRIEVETGLDEVLFEAGEWDVWSPLKLSTDGSAVFYTALARDPVRNVNHLRLMKRELSTGRETQLFQRESGFFSFYGLLVSPDASRLVFLDSVASGPRTLVSMPSVGGTPSEFAPSDAAHPRPSTRVNAWMRAWTPDGRFLITKTADEAVWALPAGQGAPRKLEWPLPEVGTLSPDGKRTAFNVSKEMREVRTIDNLLSRIPVAK